MRINTCGSKEKPCILLLHTMFTTGRLFEALIPALAQDYFLVIPTLDGYDPDEKTEYPGTGEELERVEACLKEKQVRELATAAGSSLGAMLAWGLWQRRRLPIRRLVLDSPPFGWSAVQAAENTKSCKGYKDYWFHLVGFGKGCIYMTLFALAFAAIDFAVLKFALW